MPEQQRPLPADRHPEHRPDVDAWLRDVQAGTRIITLRASLGDQHAPEIPRGWDPTVGQPVGVEPAFGPLHALVVARGHQILTMDARGALEFPHRTVCVTHIDWGPDAALAALRSAAKAHDRGPVLEAALAAGQELLGALRSRPESTRRWWELRIPYPPGVLPSSGIPAREAVRELCDQELLAVLGTAAVADLVPVDLRTRCLGPWEWAVYAGQVPGPLWTARPRTIDAVRGQLDLADDVALRTAAARFAEARDTSDYRELLVRLEGYRTLGRCSPPLDQRVLRSSRARRLPDAVAGDGEQLGREILTALSLPPAVREPAWDQLTAPLVDVLPHLWRKPPPDLS
jgi:hypothetical protein